MLMHTELHWLDAPERVKYKLGVITRRCLYGSAPRYLAACSVPVSTTASRQHLRSAAGHQLVIPSHRLTYVSPFKANTSANWNAVSRQIWRGCHTSVDSGDLNQAPPKLSAVCSTCIIPALPVNCQFIWMDCAFGMSATQPILG